MRSKRNKDLKKTRKFLWGSDAPTSRSGNATLFSDRKGNNLFNGIWRMPLNEVDRAGSFSTHMAKSINTLLDYASITNDWNILCEVAIHLRKAPSSDQKYLYEKQRKSFSKQAYTALKSALRAKADVVIKNKPKESQLMLLLGG